MELPSLGLMTHDADQHNFTESRTLTSEEYATYKAARRSIIELNSSQDRLSSVLHPLDRYMAIYWDTKARLAEELPVDGASLKQQLNECLSNYLSAFRAFLDQSDRYLARKYGKDSSQRAAFKKATSDLYDSHFSYRLMDQLRNYTQHEGEGIHRVSHGQSMAPHSGDIATNLGVFVNRDSLLDDPRLKSRLKAELRKEQPDISITDLLLSHNDHVLSLHLEFVTQCSDDLRKSAETIVDLVEPLKDQPGEPIIMHMTPLGDGDESVQFKLDHLLVDPARQVLNLLDRL